MTPWSIEELLDGQHQRVDISAIPEPPARPPTEKTGRGSLLNRPSCPPDDQIGQGTAPTELSSFRFLNDSMYSSDAKN